MILGFFTLVCFNWKEELLIIEKQKQKLNMIVPYNLCVDRIHSSYQHTLHSCHLEYWVDIHIPLCLGDRYDLACYMAYTLQIIDDNCEIFAKAI